MTPVRKILLFLLFLPGIPLSAQDVLILRDSQVNYELNNRYFSIFKDSANSCTQHNVLHNTFIPSDHYYNLVDDPQATFWSKVELIDSSGTDKNWFFVFYNYSVDSLDFYVLVDDSLIIRREYSMHRTKLSDKELKHKNYSVDLSIPKNKKVILLLKSRNETSVHYGVAIKEHKHFFSYSIGEYFYYGLFYGALLLIMIYHLSFLVSLNNLSYLIYVFYTLFQGLYMTYRDALVVMFVLPENPAWIDSSYAIIYMLSSVFLLLYARFFLHLNSYKLFDVIIKIYIPLRIIAWIISPVHTNWLVLFDFVSVIIAFVFSVQSLIQKHKTSYLLFAGFTTLLVTHSINVMWQNNIIDCTAPIFYSMYYGILLETILLAFANAYRLNLLKQDALQKLELENQLIRDELKIKKQKSIIQEQKEQIDNFLYRASHDIKGPLKSIDGLSQLGLLDEKDPREYFTRIQSMTVRLQKIVDNFLAVVKNNNSKLNIEPVALKNLVDQCIEDQFFEYPGRNEIFIQNKIPPALEIASEYYSLYSIVQNIVENAIKYRDSAKQNRYLIIEANIANGRCLITLEDNGLGIEEQAKEKIFSMFYRANLENADGVGMGLYIVRQSLERIEGKISIESEEGLYSRFIIELPAQLQA